MRAYERIRGHENSGEYEGQCAYEAAELKVYEAAELKVIGASTRIKVSAL